MNTARLETARYRNGNVAIYASQPARAMPASPLRRLGRAWLGLIRRRCLANDPRDQLWTWFLPNPLAGQQQKPEQSRAQRASERTRSANIVLVEPESKIRDKLRLWLQLDGHMVAECADESEALKVIAQE